MDETRYHTYADATLERYYDALDAAFDTGAIDDLELQGGILTIITESGHTYVLSKHGVMKQLWLASRQLGGLHFNYDDASGNWALSDGRQLHEVLAGELKREGIEVNL